LFVNQSQVRVADVFGSSTKKNNVYDCVRVCVMTAQSGLTSNRWCHNCL